MWGNLHWGNFSSFSNFDVGEAMLHAEGAVGENLYLYNYNKLLYKYKIYFTCIGMADAARGEGGLSLKLLK